jgi:excisionase family DNA binding protein
MSEFLTVSQTAIRLNVSEPLIYAWVTSGKLNALRLPHARESSSTTKNRSAIRIKLDELEKFLHSLDGMDAGR